MKDHAVAVMIVAPEGIPLVRDPKKPAPVFWKFPGGRSKPGETAEACAFREVQEEIGVTLRESNLEVVQEEDKGSHVVTLFTAKLPLLPKLKSRGDEREKVKVFSPREILALKDFFPNHKKAFGGILTELARRDIFPPTLARRASIIAHRHPQRNMRSFTPSPQNSVPTDF